MKSIFDQYMNVIMEEVSFDALPLSVPYGFWVSPYGEEFWIVHNLMQHELVAKNIILKNNSLGKSWLQAVDKNKELGPSYFLLQQGFIRVAIDRDDDVLMYSGVKTPNRKQAETISDIAQFYELSVERDRAKV